MIWIKPPTMRMLTNAGTPQDQSASTDSTGRFGPWSSGNDRSWGARRLGQVRFYEGIDNLHGVTLVVNHRDNPEN